VATDKATLSGPDFAAGVPVDELPDGGKILGHAHGEEVLLVRTRGELFAISPHCTHYHGPLAEGLVVGGTVRCPWHHACFDLQTGEALKAPAIDPIQSWNLEQRDGLIAVTTKRSRPKPASHDTTDSAPQNIVIVGGGAAGFAAADMLRREGYKGALIMLSRDSALPYDRPNLSKDYLAGTAPFEYVPLKDERFYAENNIETRLGQEVLEIDVGAREVIVAGGNRVPYDRLLLAMGAEPIRLTIPGADQPHVHTLRSLTDCQSIIECAKSSRRAVVIGASFIGLEVAASLRGRDLEVHVVAPDKRPMERVLGPEMSDFIRSLHESHGVIFHLEEKVASIDDKSIQLDKGGTINDVGLVVVGIGVRPRLTLAENAGLKLERGVVVDQYLETSVGSIFAAGDIARWPDAYSGECIRIEHWVVAERQGQTAARNMLGLRTPFADAPFFWSQHYDIPINYVGHAAAWDAVEIDGDINAKDCILRFKQNGRVKAVASIFRDVESLKAELEMESNK
jgi:NADPH-dependent 2,4-dienoyl-CoA reductase/sulfur reductase-like enzyme/nitrite reductase/ring-hydroxylating ferredoxin subunit